MILQISSGQGPAEGEQMKLQINTAWKVHNRIVRGNPVRTYEGPAFKRKAKNDFITFMMFRDCLKINDF